MLNRIFNSPEVNKFLGSNYSPVEDTILNIAQCMKNHAENKTSLSWSIYLSEKPNESTIIGRIDLRLGDESNPNRANLGYMMDQAYWGSGFMTEVVKSVVEFGFNEINHITSIGILAFHPNIGSQRVAQKCGFILDGVIRDGFNKDGVSYNTHIYTILRSEHPSVVKE